MIPVPTPIPIPAPVQLAALVKVRPIVILKSSTASVVVFNVVVVPLTVKSPVTITLPAKVALPLALPMFNAVDAPPAKLTVVAVSLRRAKVELPATRLVVMVGLVPNTNEPDPVSSVIALMRLALDGVAKNVPTFAPRLLV